MRNPEPPSTASAGTARTADWEAIRLSQPADYDGATRFSRMTPHERLRWLDLAAEFVFANARKSARVAR